MQTLKQQWENLKAENPHLRIRNAADQLGVSEMELLATQIGASVIRLKPEISSILGHINTLGDVMALTRNDACVHEKTGNYGPINIIDSTHVAFNTENVQLVINLSQWAKVFVVQEPAGDMVRKSIQFFSQQGEALHKIYLRPTSDEAAFETLIATFKANNQEPTEEVTDRSIPAKEQANIPEATIEDNEIIVKVLEQMVETKLPLEVIVKNQGLQQTHQGRIRKLMWHHTWYNIMDPNFNMHLAMDQVAFLAVIQNENKAFLAAYTKGKELIVTFSNPTPENEAAWKELVQSFF